MALSSRVHRPFAGVNPVKSRRAVWLAVFLGIFLVCAAWATVAPYDGTPDETEHAINAYAVADGQVFKTRSTTPWSASRCGWTRAGVA
jgi:hypothetical protein